MPPSQSTSGRRPHVAHADDAGSVERHSGLTVRELLPGEITAWDVAAVEFTLGPRRLIPPHAHTSDDEIAYVLEGDVSFRIGDETFVANPGTLVYKPRGIMHTFWNASDRPARLLEFAIPGGFEVGFRASGTPTRPDAPERQNVHSDDWVPELKARDGLRLIGE